VRSRDVQCHNCRHQAILNVDHLPGDLTSPSQAAHRYRTRCGFRMLTLSAPGDNRHRSTQVDLPLGQPRPAGRSRQDATIEISPPVSARRISPACCRVFTAATLMPSDKARVDVSFDLKGAAQRVEIDPSPRLATSKKLGRDIPSCPPVGLRRPRWAALARRACSILLSAKAAWQDYTSASLAPAPAARSLRPRGGGHGARSRC
jgi:hypothetical protein